MTTKIIIAGVIGLVLFAAGFEALAGTEGEAACWILLLAALGCILVLIPLSLRMMAHRRRAGFVGLSAAMIGGLWLVLSFAPGGDRVISRTVAPDGTEMCLIQRFTGDWAEPYRVAFYYRRPGQQWGSFYYEHEDTRWWFGSIRTAADGERATIRRFVLPVAYFDMATESFTIVRWGRTLSPAQTWMPADWKPESQVAW